MVDDRRIIPIHTFHPDKYADLFSQKIEQVSDGEVFGVESELDNGVPFTGVN